MHIDFVIWNNDDLKKNQKEMFFFEKKTIKKTFLWGKNNISPSL